jgi:dGTPase
MFESLRRMLSAQLGDMVQATAAAVAEQQPADVDAVRAAPTLARLGEVQREHHAELKRFLFDQLYRHSQLNQATELARTVVTDLFAAYCDRPAEMPEDYAHTPALARSVADYIAGMTDRFALREHHRLTGRRLFEA